MKPSFDRFYGGSANIRSMLSSGSLESVSITSPRYNVASPTVIYGRSELSLVATFEVAFIFALAFIITYSITKPHTTSLKKEPFYTLILRLKGIGVLCSNLRDVCSTVGIAILRLKDILYP